ncbi:MAG: two-component system response regulator, partial [Gammaproteobacteria bacterium]|nr:two-component system response regulator [Gammaproteobacteria bacterium]
GYQVMEKLSIMEECKTIPVIAVSANAMNTDLERGKKSGFKAYVTKPIDIDAFLDVIKQQLADTV